MKIQNSLPYLIATLLASVPASGAEKIELYALFNGKAIVMVDGARHVLAVGDTSPEGVKLVATNTQQETADIEVDGKREQLRLGVVMSGSVSAGKGTVTLYAEQSGHYFADGLINDVPVRFLVDTGATAIAMNSGTAQRVGIDYKRFGRVGVANTAGGLVRSYSLKLEKVQIGEITLYGVDAGVIEGGFPTDVLLGMSFLGRLDMKRDDQKLELSER